MYRAVILKPAKKDILNAAIWYNEKQPGQGKRFTQFIRQKVRRICLNPHHYVVRYSTVRTAVVDIFSFLIHFVVNENDRSVIVTAVLHTSQNPDIWTERQQ